MFKFSGSIPTASVSQSAPDAFASLVTSAELTAVRIILGHCKPVCPSTGGEDPAGRDRPGYELSRMIYGHSIWVWWQLNGVGQNRTAWQTLVEMATLLTSSRWWWWWWNVSGGVAFLSRKVKGHIVIRQEKEWKHVVNQFTVNNLWW